VIQTQAVQQELQNLARFSDALERPAGTGYYATEHGMLKGHLAVFAPCRCVLVMNAYGDSLLTLCNTPECCFLWSDALDAVAALRTAQGVDAAPKVTSIEVKVSEEPPDEAYLASLVPNVD